MGAASRIERPELSGVLAVRVSSKVVYTTIVGLNHYQTGINLSSAIRSGLARLLREPSNPHDPNAIAVVIRGRTVGHIDRLDAHALAPLLDSGARAEVSLVHWRRSGLRIAVRLTKEPGPVAPPDVGDQVTGIYAIGFNGLEDVYVGQLRDISRRLRQHWEDLTCGLHANVSLQMLWRGLEQSAHVKILERVPEGLGHIETSNWLVSREQHWIDSYRSLGRCLNMVDAEFVATSGVVEERAERRAEAHRAAARIVRLRRRKALRR